jgi:lipopolysaccharide export system protein LptA
MNHFGRIAGSFVIVVVTYWAYALLAVPWIEPSIEFSRQNQPRPPDMRDVVEEQLKEVRPYFPGGRFEALGLQRSKVIQLNGAKLLVLSYSNLPDNTIKIEPCIIVMAYDGPAENEEQRLRQAIVLEAPQGALLRFDGPVDLGGAKMGRLKGGRLVGPVTIHSDWKQPGADDDLEIKTRDIDLVDQTVSTPNPVDFRWGSHFGRGRGMVMKLSTGAPRVGMEAAGPNINGITSFELQQVERLHLDLGQATASAPTGGKPESVPVEIQCRGPFRFDVARRVATFRDAVEVSKLNPAGPADQLFADVLALYFADRKPGKPDPGVARAAADVDSLDLMAERLEARGNPVRVTAPSQQLIARGPRIEHNLREQSVTLDGDRDVFLQQGSNEIHAATYTTERPNGDAWARSSPKGRAGSAAN